MSQIETNESVPGGDGPLTAAASLGGREAIWVRPWLKIRY
jgi:hypothetical protein